MQFHYTTYLATFKHKNPCSGSASLRAISRSNYKGGHFTYVCSDHFPHGDGRTWKHEVPTLFLPQKTEKTTKLRSTKNSTHSEMELESVEVDWCYFTIH